MFLTATVGSDRAKWFDYHSVVKRISKKVDKVMKPTLPRGNFLSLRQIIIVE